MQLHNIIHQYMWVIQLGRQHIELHCNKNDGDRQVMETSDCFLEGMEDTSQSPQGYAILIMDLFMATDQSLR